jgi:predicted transcriptional regulator
MVITLAPDLVAALSDLAQKRGVAPEALAVNALRERFLDPGQRVQPRDEWERGLLAAATDCGVSLSNEAVSSEGLYE